MGDAFRDAIQNAAEHYWNNPDIDVNDQDHEGEADAILAMPEMEAIRAYLLAERDGWCCDDCWKVDANTGERRLPESVIDWVLS